MSNQRAVLAIAKTRQKFQTNRKFLSTSFQAKRLLLLQHRKPPTRQHQVVWTKMRLVTVSRSVFEPLRAQTRCASWVATVKIYFEIPLAWNAGGYYYILICTRLAVLPARVGRAPRARAHAHALLAGPFVQACAGQVQKVVQARAARAGVRRNRPESATHLHLSCTVYTFFPSPYALT